MGDDYLGGDADGHSYPSPRSYALSGRIMLSAIIILFFVVVVMVSLHLYARWYLLRSRQRLRRNRLNRRTHIVLYADLPTPSASRGLDSSVLKSLPVFTFSSASRIGGAGEAPSECAVCLSEFEDGEAARLLPRCKHSFHVECIDMWFHSHSTCPICRSPVEAAGEEFVAIAVADRPEAGTSSGLCSSCRHGDAPGMAAASSSSAEAPPPSGRRKPPELGGFSIEVPRWTDPEDEPRCDTPASRLRSPVSRMLSFRRILNRERWGASHRRRRRLRRRRR
ncbi:RING-H2 finger protein ATL2 [Rhodamnia argentea]|uniref:RING-type E3 ubiquitin transferase n=1 Tax=Rhodamnia argentea TaxID=178133 RepID=A0A8B8QET0_9MYRT|nr:RING-H2 finger protein ATL2 [Rhodamnia argentea]